MLSGCHITSHSTCVHIAKTTTQHHITVKPSFRWLKGSFVQFLLLREGLMPSLSVKLGNADSIDSLVQVNLTFCLFGMKFSGID